MKQLAWTRLREKLVNNASTTTHEHDIKGVFDQMKEIVASDNQKDRSKFRLGKTDLFSTVCESIVLEVQIDQHKSGMLGPDLVTIPLIRKYLKPGQYHLDHYAELKAARPAPARAKAMLALLTRLNEAKKREYHLPDDEPGSSPPAPPEENESEDEDGDEEEDDEDSDHEETPSCAGMEVDGEGSEATESACKRPRVDDQVELTEAAAAPAELPAADAAPDELPVAAAAPAELEAAEAAPDELPVAAAAPAELEAAEAEPDPAVSAQPPAPEPDPAVSAQPPAPEPAPAAPADDLEPACKFTEAERKDRLREFFSEVLDLNIATRGDKAAAAQSREVVASTRPDGKVTGATAFVNRTAYNNETITSFAQSVIENLAHSTCDTSEHGVIRAILAEKVPSLYEHQVMYAMRARQVMKNHKMVVVGLKMGGGKTATTLAMLEIMLALKEIDSAIITAPLLIAQNWIYEIKRLNLATEDQVCRISVKELKDPAFIKRFRARPTQAKFIVILVSAFMDYECLPGLTGLCATGTKTKVLVIDESQKYHRGEMSIPATIWATLALNRSHNLMTALVTSTPVTTKGKESKHILKHGGVRTFVKAPGHLATNPCDGSAGCSGKRETMQLDIDSLSDWETQKILLAHTVFTDPALESGVVEPPPPVVAYIRTRDGAFAQAQRLSRRRQRLCILNGHGTSMLDHPKAELAIEAGYEWLRQHPEESVMLVLENVNGINELAAQMRDELGGKVLVFHSRMPDEEVIQNLDKAMYTGGNLIIATPQAIAEGLNLPKVTCAFVMTETYLRTWMIQIRARMWRPPQKRPPLLFIMVSGEGNFHDRVRTLADEHDREVQGYYGSSKAGNSGEKPFSELEQIDLDKVPALLAGYRALAEAKLHFPTKYSWPCGSLTVVPQTTTQVGVDRAVRILAPRATKQELAAQKVAVAHAAAARATEAAAEAAAAAAAAVAAAAAAAADADADADADAAEMEVDHPAASEDAAAAGSA